MQTTLGAVVTPNAQERVSLFPTHQGISLNFPLPKSFPALLAPTNKLAHELVSVSSR